MSARIFSAPVEEDPNRPARRRPVTSGDTVAPSGLRDGGAGANSNLIEIAVAAQNAGQRLDYGARVAAGCFEQLNAQFRTGGKK